MVENLQKESIISQRIVYDQICVNDVKVHEIDIPKGLVISCKMASKKYKAALEAKRKETLNAEESRKRKLIQVELAEVKRNKSELEQSVMLLLKDADKYSQEAEKKRDFAILANANIFRETASKKKVLIKTLDKTIGELENKAKR